MRLLAVTAVPLVLIALGCGPADRGGAAAESGPSSGTPAQVPSAVAKPRDGIPADAVPVPFVRVAELEIDPAQLDAYTAAVREEMETSVRVEPGVLSIHCVAEKDSPARLRFFEMYADEAAYKAHIESAHFKKYVLTTKAMIVSRKLIDVVPVRSARRQNDDQPRSRIERKTMPHVIVKLWPGKSEQQKTWLAERITQAVTDVLGYGEESVSVAMEEVEPRDWKEQVYKPDIAGKPWQLYKKPGYDPSELP
jgi:quinol monooxygenase YgiN/phenylpyruvate tautomerase PptA (4-oxalocrotonate tautomerase family)